MEMDQEGYRFHPTDSELLTFLVRFIARKDLRDDGYITKHDVYKQEPWVTYGYGCHSGGQDNEDTSIYRYFITPRHKKGDRFSRVVGEKLGTWKQQDKGKNVIMTSSGNQSKSMVIGRRKSVCYETTRCCPDNGKWLMKEYVFCESILRKFKKSKLKDYVICAIKEKAKRNSSNGTKRSNVITTMDLGVNSVEPSIDQEYKVITPISIVEPKVEPEVQIDQEATGEENDVLGLTTFSQIQDMLDQDYAMISSNIDVVGYPMLELDDLEVQIQEAAGEENDLGLTTFSQIQEFENAMPEINLPEEPVLWDKNLPQYQPAPLQEGCSFGVNEDPIAYLELEANNTSFVELLSGGAHSAIRNNQVQTQEAPREENGQLELNTFSQIQEPVIMPEICSTLAEYMGVTVLMDPDYEMIIPFDFSEQAIVESNEPQVQQTQEVNGLSGLTAPFSQIQEFVMPENNVPEMADMSDTLLEKNQTQHQRAPQEESETLYETEESSFVYDLVEAMLDNATMKDRLDAMMTNQSTLIFDQQSWQSKVHFQDMLL